MFRLQPRYDHFTQFTGEGGQFLGLFDADLSRGVVFGGVSFGAAGVEIVGVRLALGTEDDLQGLQCAVVREVLFRTPAFSVDQNGAELERGVLGDAELPIGRQPTGGVFEIPIHDGKQVRDLASRGLMWAKPPGFSPVVQAHRLFL